MKKIKLTCVKCGYVWEARKSNPKECPNCKNRAWKESGKKKIIKKETSHV